MGREHAVYDKFREDHPVLKDQPVWEAFELLLKSCKKGGKPALGNGRQCLIQKHIVGER